MNLSIDNYQWKVMIIIATGSWLCFQSKLNVILKVRQIVKLYFISNSKKNSKIKFPHLYKKKGAETCLKLTQFMMFWQIREYDNND